MKLDRADHAALARWGAACTERVVAIFEAACPGDSRPRNAIELLNDWARGKATVADARAAAVAAHAAARAAPGEAARAAARACGQAVAIAHMPAHARHAAAYAQKAVRLASGDARSVVECAWQRSCLPAHLHHIWDPPSA